MDLRGILKKYGVEDETLISALSDYENDLTKNTVPLSRLNKKVAQYHDLQEKFTEAEVQLERATNSDDLKNLESLQTENVSLKGKLLKSKRTQWSYAKKKITDEKVKEKFELIKDQFTFAEDGKDLEMEQIETNLKAFDTYDKIKYFDIQNNNQNFNGQRAGAGELPKKREDIYLKNIRRQNQQKE